MLAADNQGSPRKDNPDSELPRLDPMLEAGCTTLLSHVHNLIAMLPSVHKIMRMDSRLDSERTHRGRMMSLMQDAEWSHRVHELASALVRYLSAMRLLGVALPDDSVTDIARLAVTCLEVTIILGDMLFLFLFNFLHLILFHLILFQLVGFISLYIYISHWLSSKWWCYDIRELRQRSSKSFYFKELL